MVAIDPKQKRRKLAVAVAAVAALFLVPLLCASNERTVARIYRRRLAKNWCAKEEAQQDWICVKPCVARLRARRRVFIFGMRVYF
jgi:hypothetical protein